MNQATRQAQFTEYAAAKLPWLRRVAYLLCQDWHRADDLVQTSVTKLYLNWHRVENAANPDGYARTILVNTFLEEQRSPWWRRVTLHRDRAGEDPAGPDELLDRIPDPAVHDIDGAMDLRRALPHLAARQRTTLVLRYYCELSVVETAQALGCSTGTVKSQTARALEHLRRLMGVDGEDPGNAEPPPDGPPGHGGRAGSTPPAPGRDTPNNHVYR
ncbi:MAG TPA: SigE family RNA polymerase sigma factor [Actinocrinis sp.]